MRSSVVAVAAIVLTSAAATGCASSAPRVAPIPAAEGLTTEQCMQVFGEPHPPATLVDLAGWSMDRRIPTDCGEDRVVHGANGDGECHAGPVALDGAKADLAIRVRAIDGELFVVGVATRRAR